MPPRHEQLPVANQCPHGNDPADCWYCKQGAERAENQPDEVPPEQGPLSGVETELAAVAIGQATEKNETKGDKNEDKVLADARSQTYGVLDGMGGHAAGEVASMKAVQFILEGMARMPKDIRGDGAQVAEHVRSTMIQASENIRAIAEADPQYRGMGTTASIMHLIEQPDGGVPREAVIAQVGDSRVYRLRGGVLERLTKDQSPIQNESDSGRIPPDADQIGDPEADKHISEDVRMLVSSFRNRINSAVGVKGATIDVTRVPIENGDVLFATSDGVHDNLTDREIGTIAQKFAGDPQALSVELTRASRERSRDKNHIRHKDDDISAVALRIQHAAAEAPQTEQPRAAAKAVKPPRIEQPPAVAEAKESSPVPQETLEQWRAAPTKNLELIAVEYRRILAMTSGDVIAHPSAISRAYGLHEKYATAQTDEQRKRIMALDRRYKTTALDVIDKMFAERAGTGSFAQDYNEPVPLLRAEEWLPEYKKRLVELARKNQTPEALLDAGRVTRFKWTTSASAEQVAACLTAEREHVRRRIEQCQRSLERSKPRE